MGKVLTIDEMLEVLTIRNHMHLKAMVAAVEAVATLAARMVAQELLCVPGEAKFEPGFGGTCASFTPSSMLPLPWPDDLSHLDSGGEFEFGASDV